MPRIIAAIAISLLAGFAMGGWLMGSESQTGDALTNMDSSLPAAERLVNLEKMFSEEREARLNLEKQIQLILEEIERIDSTGPRAFAELTAKVEKSRAAAEGVEDRSERRRSRNVASMMQNYQEQRVAQLTSGGFSDSEARSILMQESEAQFKAMQQTWEAQRNGETLDPFAALNMQSVLRDELGDSAYERYLDAQGQPTSIQITQVMSGSPGSNVGLQSGDHIVSYDNKRVFNIVELRELTMQGRVGEDVIIEIERDGITMQLSVPRGPVGVSGSGASIRNMNRWGGG